MQTAWRIDETIVLLFFSSCKVSQAICKNFISDRCGIERGVISIRGRLTSFRHIILRENKPTLYDCKAKIWLRKNVDDWIKSQGYSNLQWLIRFEAVDAMIVARYQKIDPVLKEMSHSSLLAKSRFHSAVPLDPSVTSSVDEPDEGVDILTDQFVPSSIGELNEEIDFSTNQLVLLSIDKSKEEANEDIHLFRYFIRNVL